jgi:predicted tellurium resistance membrane protein TerC
LWQIVPLIAVTDLAFSLDSVTTAVALSSQVWLVLTGGIIGVIALRFLAGLFVQWLNTYVYHQDAAYLTILGVGTRLMCKALFPDYVPPEWAVLMFIGVLFTWGFSKRVLPNTQ